MKSGLLLTLLTLATAPLALGQEGTGDITGLVIHGSTREPLPSANVQVLETQRGAATDVDGRFTLQGLQPGTYQLRVSLVGYSPVLLSDIVVATGRPVDLVVTLE